MYQNVCFNYGTLIVKSIMGDVMVSTGITNHYFRAEDFAVLVKPQSKK